MNSVASQRNSLRFATVMVLTAAFVVVQTLALFAMNLQNVLTLWGQDLQVNVYLSEQATPAQAEQIQNSLRQNDQVDRVEYISAEKALHLFQEQMASYAPNLLKSDLLKVIPASIQFSLSAKVSPQDQLSTMKSLAERLKTQAGVDEISYGQDWVKTYAAFVLGAKSAIGFLAFALAAAALLVISNVIRQSIHSRRDTIEVLELVGATAGFIRRPFLQEGALLSLISGAMALGLSWGIYSWLQTFLRRQLGFFQLAHNVHFFSFAQGFGLLLACALLGFLASYFCLRSLNDGWAASQRVNHE
jgi:cell division transport system permease protein